MRALFGRNKEKRLMRTLLGKNKRKENYAAE